jgi:hypothetical protein
MVPSNVDHPIRSEWSKCDDEDDDGIFVADGERPGGAMARERDTSLPGTIQRMESTERTRGRW